jgi:hypothetical protein
MIKDDVAAGVAWVENSYPRSSSQVLCYQMPTGGSAVTSLDFSGTLEMLKLLEDLVSAGDGREAEP